MRKIMANLFYILLDNQVINLLENTLDFAMANAQYRAIQEQKDLTLHYRGIKVKVNGQLEDIRLGTFIGENGEFYPSEWFDNNPILG
jgi:hypothetical protein